MYAMTRFRLRRELRSAGEIVTHLAKKQAQKLTLKWMLFFRRVRGRKFKSGEETTVIVTNMISEL